MRFRINLATRDYHKTRMVRLFLGLLSVVLIVLGGLQIQGYQVVQDDLGFLTDNSKQVEGSRRLLEQTLRARGMDISEKGVESFGKQVNVLNRLITQKAFSWTLFLNELESAVAEDVSVSKVQPRFPEGKITLTGKGLTLRDLTRFMVRLEGSEAFEDVFLKKQNTDDEGFVEFIVEFKYHSGRQLVRS